MTYDEKIAWLKRFQAALHREKLLREELKMLKERSTSNSKALGGLPGGTQDGQSLPRAVESIIRAKQELQCQINICGAIRREVVAAIGQLPDELDQDILRQRYIMGQEWWKIAVAVNLSDRQAYRRAEAAVHKLDI